MNFETLWTISRPKVKVEAPQPSEPASPLSMGAAEEAALKEMEDSWPPPGCSFIPFFKGAKRPCLAWNSPGLGCGDERVVVREHGEVQARVREQGQESGVPDVRHDHLAVPQPRKARSLYAVVKHSTYMQTKLKRHKTL